MKLANTSINVIKTNKEDVLFKKLQQDYEEEFSSITGYEKGADGYYAQDMLISHWSLNGYDIYLVFSETKEPIGFAVVNLSSMLNGDLSVRDIAEFYVVPSHRKSGLGKQMAFSIFSLYPGKWEVRQLPGLEIATQFWNSVIAEFTNGDYRQEDLSQESWTGPVQFFVSKGELAINKVKYA